MNEFAGRTVVLRVDDTVESADSTVPADIAFLTEQDVHPIVVAPNAAAARSFVRVLNRLSNAAVGLSGADAGLIPAGSSDGIGAVQAGILRTLIAGHYVPVIEPTALGLSGGEIDLAADHVARAIACATDAARAIFFNPSGGVTDPATAALIDELTPAEALALAEDPEVPARLRTALRAAALGVRGGVGAAHIIDGRIAHAAIIEFLTAQHVGTRVAGTVYIGSS